MTWLAVFAWAGTFVGTVCFLGGLAAWVAVWRTQCRATREARAVADRVHATHDLRAARCRLQAVIDAEDALHGYSRLSEQLRAEAMADGVAA